MTVQPAFTFKCSCEDVEQLISQASNEPPRSCSPTRFLRNSSSLSTHTRHRFVFSIIDHHQLSAFPTHGFYAKQNKKKITRESHAGLRADYVNRVKKTRELEPQLIKIRMCEVRGCSSGYSRLHFSSSNAAFIPTDETICRGKASAPELCV